MDSKGPYSPPSGGNQSRVLGLAVNQLSFGTPVGSSPTPPTNILELIKTMNYFDCLKRWHALESKHAAVAQW